MIATSAMIALASLSLLGMQLHFALGPVAAMQLPVNLGWADVEPLRLCLQADECLEFRVMVTVAALRRLQIHSPAGSEPRRMP